MPATLGLSFTFLRGIVHGFRYGNGGGQMLEITRPGALAAQMFTAIDKEIPPDRRMFQSCLMCSNNGVTVAV